MKETAVISLWNLKGGVGKTTLAFHLAYEVAKRDKKVLCIDLDSQCNLSSFFENKDGSGWSNSLTILDALTEAPADLIGASAYDNLHFVRGCENAMKMEQAGNAISHRIYTDIVRTGNYDYIFIDCHPGMSHLENSFLSITDLILIPINLDGFSRDNANLVMQHLTDLESKGGHDLICKMVANKVRGTVKTQRMIYEDMDQRHDYPLLPICIRDTSAVVSANALHKPLSLHRSKATATEDIRELAGYIASDDWAKKGE